MVTKANNVSRLTAAFVFQAMEKKKEVNLLIN